MSANLRATDETRVPPCAQRPALFHRPEPDRESLAQREWREQAAKALCAQCRFHDPAMWEWCLQTAGDDEGIRGGLTVEERRSNRRRAARQAKKEAAA